MSVFNINQTIDVMDVFDDLPSQDKTEFLYDAFKGLSFNDQGSVVEDMACYLAESQMKKVATAMFAYMEPDDCYDMVRTLVDMLATSQKKRLVEHLKEN